MSLLCVVQVLTLAQHSYRHFPYLLLAFSSSSSISALLSSIEHAWQGKLIH